jgi:hypothetical protein
VGHGHQLTIAEQAEHWPTPAARDWKGANGPEHLDASTGSLHLDQLPNFVQHLWSTPLGTGGTERSLPVPASASNGSSSSRTRRALNPLFVEILMGWPSGFTLLLLNESTGCACSATELFLYRQHMRGALSQLSSHEEAPAQLNLFG